MIRKFLTGVILSIISFKGLSQSRINVSIENIENNKGTCIVCLYNSAGNFSDKGTPVQCATVAIQDKTTTAAFENIRPGTYAVLVIHDANNNRKFDTNILGIPKEGYGASQNKLPFAAAPRFEENKFAVAENATIQCNIQLRYIF